MIFINHDATILTIANIYGLLYYYLSYKSELGVHGHSQNWLKIWLSTVASLNYQTFVSAAKKALRMCSWPNLPCLKMGDVVD